MTRKDYEAFANILLIESNANWEYPPGVGESFGRAECFRHGYREACKNIAFDLISIFEADNPRFDKERFIKACGL